MKEPATLVVCRNPFRPLANRETGKIRRGTRIDTVLRQRQLLKGVRRTCRYLVVHNGEAILQADWNRKVASNDVVEIVHLPAGGGGSNPLQVILTVALVALAVWVPGLWGFAAGTWQAAAISGAVMIGGSMLVNSMFPPPGADTASLTREKASPNYTISAQNNGARLMEAIPVLYGQFRIYPDFAAYPYSENRGNQQYVYQLLCITQGRIDRSSLQLFIEDTPFSSFAEVEYELVEPYQPVTLFPANVVTSNAVQNLSMDANLVLGPFVVNAAGTTCNALAVDLVLPGGLAYVNDKGGLDKRAVSWRFSYQAIDGAGMPLGPWTDFEARHIEMSTEDPQMLTYKASVPPGRYQVQGQRSNPEGETSRTRDKLQWGSLRGYLTSPANYGNVTLLAIAMRATNNLNSSTARRINVVAQRILPTWDPVNGWGPEVPTRNPAWAIADIIRNQDYGRGLGTSRMNIQELYRLAGVWAARGDEFNGVYDTTSQLWDALTKACRPGRTVPIYYAGLIDFVRNEPKSLPTAMFQPANMVKGSFNTEYQFAERDSPDHIVIEYVDRNTWQPTQVECSLPGSTTNQPAHLSFFGVTNRDQAWREGMSMAAANRDQRRLITFTTEQEGLLVRFGDLVQVSHDVPAWGYSGRVESLNPTTGALRTTEPLPWAAGESHVIAFRRRDGSMHGPFSILPGPSGDPYQAQVSGATASVYVSDGLREERTFYQFGPVNRAGLKCLVRAGSPSSDGKVALSLVNYADSVHAAENGGIVPPPPPASNLPRPPVLPIIDFITLEYTLTAGVQKIVVTPANGASHYEFQYRSETKDEWAVVGLSPDPFMVVTLAPGYWYVRARGIGGMAGPWATWEGFVQASTLPLPELAVAWASLDQVMQITVSWVFAASKDTGNTASVELWWSASNSLFSAARLMTIPYPGTSFTVGSLGHGDQRWFFLRCINSLGQAGPWYNGGVGISGAATTDASKILSYLTGKITETQLGQTLLNRIDTAANAAIEVQETLDDLSAMYTIKTQMSVGGRTYIAGIGVGVENNQGIIESQVLIAADRFALLHPNGTTTSSPFVIENGNTYINTAYIGTARITSANIQSLDAGKITANSLSAISANLGTITAGWLQNPSGSTVLNLNAVGTQQVMRSGVLTYYGPLLGSRYPFELYADGFAFFGRDRLSGGAVRASGTVTLSPADAPAIVFRSITPPSDSGGA